MILASVFVIFYAPSVLAQGYVNIPIPAQQGYDRNNPYKTNGDPNYRYRGASGTQYQYDMSNPGDQVRYSVDVNAQMRDSLNVNPGVDIDRGLGQRGGGIRR